MFDKISFKTTHKKSKNHEPSWRTKTSRASFFYSICRTRSEEYPNESLFRPNGSGGCPTFQICLKQSGEHLTDSLNHPNQSGAHPNDQRTNHCGAHPTHRGTSPEFFRCSP